MAATNRSRPRRTQRGIAAIEFAVTAIFLVGLVLGSVDLGRAVYQYNALVKSARTGARYLATAQPGDATAQANAINLVRYGTLATGTTPLVPGLDTATITICDAVNCPGKSPNPNLWYKAPRGAISRGGVNLVTVTISDVVFDGGSGFVPLDFTYGPIAATVTQGM